MAAFDGAFFDSAFFDTGGAGLVLPRSFVLRLGGQAYGEQSGRRYGSINMRRAGGGSGRSYGSTRSR